MLISTLAGLCTCLAAVGPLQSMPPGAPLPAASPTVLTLDAALTRAREHAPALIAARSRVEEAEGLLDEAAVPFAEDPVLATGLGQRHGETGRHTDWSIELSQRFEASGHRKARIGIAQADLLAERARNGDAERLLLTDVATAFHETLAAQQRVALFDEARRVAAELLAAAERREQAGELGQLEVSLARTAAARASTDDARERAALRMHAATLGALVGLPPRSAVEVRGDLLASAPSEPGELDELLARAAQRPDLAAVEAETRAAESELDLAESQGRPEFGLRLGLEQDDGDEVALVGLDIGLPVWGRGRGLRSAAAARISARRAGLASLRDAVDAEVSAAFAAHALLADAARSFEASALDGLDENERLARKAWESGGLTLLELLAVRREIIATRLEWLELQLDTAAAGLRLQLAVGVLP